MNTLSAERSDAERRRSPLTTGALTLAILAAALVGGCGDTASTFDGSRITYRVEGRESYRETVDAPLEKFNGVYEVVGDRATLGLGSLQPGKCMTENAVLEVTDGIREEKRTYSSHEGHCETTSVEVCVDERDYDLVWGDFSGRLCPVYSGQFEPETVRATGEFVAAWK